MSPKFVFRSSNTHQRVLYLPAQHLHLVAEYQEFDVFSAAVAGELDQHLQHLAQEQVYQRSAHGFGSLQLPRR
jgi:hypothetical protein